VKLNRPIFHWINNLRELNTPEIAKLIKKRVRIPFDASVGIPPNQTFMFFAQQMINILQEIFLQQDRIRSTRSWQRHYIPGVFSELQKFP
jgi:hypothetical protein